MPKFLDGLMPMVISLLGWNLIFGQPITASTVIIMGLGTAAFQGIRLYFKSNNSQEKNSG
jgi:hypothetical protein